VLSNVLTQPAVLVGDLVASRRADPRGRLHAELVEALALANEATRPVEPLTPTIGDEFQGAFGTLAGAVRATLLVRAGMPTEHDVRFGLGVGRVEHLGPRGGPGFQQQDGPGWWAARDAVEYVAALETRRGVPRTVRTWIGVAVTPAPSGAFQRALPGLVDVSDNAEVQALNAFLVARDHLVSAMDDRDRRILRGLLLGQAPIALAEQEGVSPSAISQRSQRSGAIALVFAHEGLG
jgi:hypothetical protein